jgi:hypothetical protein
MFLTLLVKESLLTTQKELGKRNENHCSKN